MVAWLTWPSAVYPGAPDYHTPEQIKAYISLNRPIHIKMRLLVTQKGERVFGRRSYSSFYRLLREVLML